MMLWWLPILLVVAAVIWLLRGGPGRGARDSAEQALRERYARGEVDDETYRRMLAELHRH
jgi:putative membrane protein